MDITNVLLKINITKYKCKENYSNSVRKKKKLHLKTYLNKIDLDW